MILETTDGMLKEVKEILTEVLANGHKAETEIADMADKQGIRASSVFCDADIQCFRFVFHYHTAGFVSVFTIQRKEYNKTGTKQIFSLQEV